MEDYNIIINYTVIYQTKHFEKFMDKTTKFIFDIKFKTKPRYCIPSIQKFRNERQIGPPGRRRGRKSKVSQPNNNTWLKSVDCGLIPATKTNTVVVVL